MDRTRALVMHLQACDALNRLNDALVDISWVTFKGPVFSEIAHPLPGLRTYHDVDVLVAPRSLRRVCARLRGAGWRLADFEDMLRNPDTPGEMHWISPTGVVVDLHWSMINMASRRQNFSVPTEELLCNRTPISLGRHAVWTLSPADLFVHACLHAALTGADRLLLLMDVDRLSRRITDWDEVASRAKRWRAQAQVALVLGRAHRFLGTQFPTDFHSRLGVARSLRVLIGLADIVAPVPRTRREKGLAKFVARAIRPTTLSTIGVAGHHALAGIKERTVGVALNNDGRRSADDESLEAYLAAVEALAESE